MSFRLLLVLFAFLGTSSNNKNLFPAVWLCGAAPGRGTQRPSHPAGGSVPALRAQLLTWRQSPEVCSEIPGGARGPGRGGSAGGEVACLGGVGLGARRVPKPSPRRSDLSPANKPEEQLSVEAPATLRVLLQPG